MNNGPHWTARRFNEPAEDFASRVAAEQWPPPGTVPSNENGNRGTTQDGRRYEYSGAHNGYVFLDGPEMRCYTIQVRTTEDPGTFRAFIDDARKAGVIAAYEDGSGTRLAVDDTEGSQVT